MAYVASLLPCIFLCDSYEVTGTQYNLSETEPSLNGDLSLLGMSLVLRI